MASERTLHRLGIPTVVDTCLAGGLTTCIGVEDRWRSSTVPGNSGSSAVRVVVTHAGEASFLHRGGCLRVPAGSLLLLASSWAYHSRTNSVGWHMHAGFFQGPWFAELDRHLHSGGGHRLYARPAQGWREDVVECVQAIIDQPQQWAWRVAERCARLIPQWTLDATQAGHDWQSRLHQAIQARPDATWSVAALARVLQVAPSTLAHRADLMLGCSPATWVRRQRIELAKQLLAQTGVAAVAERLGFSTPFHFSRVFTQVTGVPPSQWRLRLANLDPL